MKIQISYILILVATILFADIPQAMNYQGKLTDPAGVAVEGETEIIFRIYDVVTGGTALWTETHPAVDVEKGLFDVQLGSITPFNLPFNEGYYVELEVEGEVLAPRQALNSVGYAFRAAIADSVVGGGSGSDDDWNRTGNYLFPYYNSADSVGIGTVTPVEKLHVMGTTRLAPSALPLWGTNPYVQVKTNPAYSYALQLSLLDGNTANPRITLGSGAGTATFETIDNISLNNDVAGGIYRVRTRNTGATAFLERMTITGRTDHANVAFLNSNVGVGTSSPVYSLDVRSRLGVYDGTNFIDLNPAASQIRFSNTDVLNINSGAGYGGFESSGYIMTIDGASRNVGIGTTNPLARLALDGPGAAHYGMFIEGPSTNVDKQAALYIHSNLFSSDPPDIYNEYYGIYVNQEPTTTAVYKPTAIYGNMSNVTAAYSTGVLGRSMGTGTGGGRTYGVKGYAGGGSDHYNYAVYGELVNVGSRQGTAILGYDAIDHSSDFFGTLIDGNWAGYFHGNLITTDRTYFGDLDAYIRQDGSNNMIFRDPNTNGGAEVTLLQLFQTGNYIQNQKDSLQTAYYRIKRTFSSEDTVAYIQFSPTTTSEPSYANYGFIVDGTEFNGKGVVRGIAAICSLGTNHAADGKTIFYGATGHQYSGHGSMWGGYGSVRCSQLDGWDGAIDPAYKSRAIGLWGIAEATAPLSFDDAQPEFCFAGVRGEIIGSVNNSFTGPDTSIVAAVLGIDKTTGAGNHFAGLFLGDVMATGKIESGNIVIRGESETNDAVIQYRYTAGGVWDYQEERLINYGRSPGLSAGYWNYAAYRTARTLIKFDVSEIPSSATIVSANIKLYCSSFSGSGTYYVYRLLRHWSEGDFYCTRSDTSTFGRCDSTQITGGCSWDYYNITNAWGTPGADNTSSDRSSIAESNVSISSTGWKTWNVTSAIQNIVNGTAENYGFIIVGPSSGMNNASFRSSECDEFNLKPRLEIEWVY